MKSASLPTFTCVTFSFFSGAGTMWLASGSGQYIWWPGVFRICYKKYFQPICSDNKVLQRIDQTWWEVKQVGTIIIYFSHAYVFCGILRSCSLAVERVDSFCCLFLLFAFLTGGTQRPLGPLDQSVWAALGSQKIASKGSRAGYDCRDRGGCRPFTGWLVLFFSGVGY